MRGVRRAVKRVRVEEGGERRAQFLLNKEVSRTKQLMSLRLGGPARGFVLITSRRESERGEVHEGEEKSRALASFSSPSFSLSLSFSFSIRLSSFIFLSLAPFSLFYRGGGRKGRRPRIAKSKSRRKDRTMKKGRTRRGESRAG